VVIVVRESREATYGFVNENIKIDVEREERVGEGLVSL
jgi:hypothetical protein